MTAVATIRQADVTRIANGLRAAGVPLVRVDFEGGRVSFITGGDADAAPPLTGKNEWDEDLER